MLRYGDAILRRYYLQFVFLHIFGGEHNLVHRGGDVFQRIAQTCPCSNLTNSRPLVTSPTPTG